MRIGIDLGGTKIEIAVLDAAGTVRLRRRVPTPQGDYDATLETVVRLVREAEVDVRAHCSVGVGTPGAVSPASGLMKNCNSVCLNGRPLRQDLEALLEREIRIANDADCFALSEAQDGAAAGLPVVFGVIVGTGTGAGIVVHGRLLSGPNAIAGEWGHNSLPWPLDDERPGRACYCGRNGCIETWLSGPGLALDHAERNGETLTTEVIVSRAEAGDAACEATLARYEDRMARALAAVINVLDPHAVVLGGGMGRIARLYRSVPRLWGRYVFSDRVDTRLLAPLHGDSSGVRGAARLWDAA
ncbi:MAG: ROK family protein [Ectothiorhodospiraceae bacterium]|jgi:fructokinase|nr:ROK family protein [Ectothiorhodospiraceae bacterium]